MPLLPGRIAGLAVLIIVLVMGMTLASILCIESFMNQSRSLLSSRARLAQMNALSSVLADAEASNRDYILTGQRIYLTQYQHSISQLPLVLEPLASRQPSTDPLLMRLRPALSERVRLLQHAIDLSGQSRVAARDFIEHGSGNTVMTGIRDMLSEDERSVQAQMARQSASVARKRQFTEWVDFAAGTLAVAITIGSAWAITSSWRRRLQAETEVRSANARLETAVKERTSELERANQELESFSYSISHDLQAPLRIIDGLSAAIDRRAGAALDHDSREHFRLICDNATRMRNLITDLLEFSRLGFQEVNAVDTDMTRLVSACWADLAIMRGQHDVEFQLAPLPSCSADPRLIKQVVLNVLSNAIKYSATRETSIICVDARRLPGDLVEYRVSDNGVGFDMDAAGKLFKVFQRLHSESEFAGTGIGLAICRRIVERHGGRIWAQSIRDTGTTMHFSLPRAQPPQRRRPPFQTSHAFGDPPMEEPGIRGKRHPEAPHHGNLHHKPVHWQ